MSYSRYSPQFQAFTNNLDTTLIPKYIHKSLLIPYWKEAINKEINILIKTNAWKLTPLSKGVRQLPTDESFLSNIIQMEQ